jgi:DNA-binding MarR family transcriptional regulator
MSNNIRPKTTKTSKPDVDKSRAALAQQMADTLARPLDPHSDADVVQGNSDVLVAQWEREFAHKQSIRALTLGVRLRRIAMLQDARLQEKCEAMGIKFNDCLLLFALWRMGEPYCLRPTDILKMHSVTSGTATYRIDQLTKQGLAERLADPKDRRGYLIRMTPQGREKVETILNELLAEYNQDLAPLMAIPGAYDLMHEALRLYERCIDR